MSDSPFKIRINRPVPLEVKAWIDAINSDPKVQGKLQKTYDEYWKVRMDAMIYGEGHYRELPDGTIEHIPFGDVARE